MTRQIEYQGDVVALTEALVGFPSGGQVLLSGSTYQRVYGNLHTVQFDAHVKAPNRSLGKEGTGECESSHVTGGGGNREGRGGGRAHCAV